MEISSNSLKKLALILMYIDHAGLGLMSNNIIARLIGRLSFPLFAWIFARTWNLTSDRKRLSNRLLIVGTISQIPYIILFNQANLNIMLTFWIILEVLKAINKSHQNYKNLILILGMIAAELARASYGWYAVISVILMMNFNPVSKGWWGGWIICNVIYTLWCGWWPQIFAIGAPIILNYHEPKLDRKPTVTEQRFFYWFYPIHLAALGALSTIL